MKYSAVINLDAPGPRISRHVYGHFAEHLGHCIYGGFYVGEDSKIPNKNGLRLDVIEAFKRLNIPNLRWPGGCFADEYHWMNGIGPKSKRPLMINTHWGGVVENNHFGTHEFMELCELLETEPYITGNLGSGSVEEMSQWIEYLSFDGKSPMTELRKENGRDKPWKIKYWGVGNENWGCGGNMTAEFYVDQARRYGTYCRNYGDNRLYKIACGPNSGDYQWMMTVMKSLVGCPNCPPEMGVDRFISGVSLHYYTVQGTWMNKGAALDGGTDAWLDLVKKAWVSDEFLTRHSAIMDAFDPDRKLGLVFDEWGTWHRVEEGTNPGFLYQQNTIRDAIVAGLHLDMFHRHTERLYMANIAQAVNVLQAPILTRGDEMILTPTYHVLEMNKGHMEAINLPVYMDTEKFQSEFGGGKFTNLSLSASRKDTAYLISVTNADPEKEKTLAIDLRGGEVKTALGRILTASKLNSHNDFGTANEVVPRDFTDFKIRDGVLEFTIPAHSFMTFRLS